MYRRTAIWLAEKIQYPLARLIAGSTTIPSLREAEERARDLQEMVERLRAFACECPAADPLPLLCRLNLASQTGEAALCALWLEDLKGYVEKNGIPDVARPSMDVVLQLCYSEEAEIRGLAFEVVSALPLHYRTGMNRQLRHNENGPAVQAEILKECARLLAEPGLPTSDRRSIEGYVLAHIESPEREVMAAATLAVAATKERPSIESLLEKIRSVRDRGEKEDLVSVLLVELDVRGIARTYIPLLVEHFGDFPEVKEFVKQKERREVHREAQRTGVSCAWQLAGGEGKADGQTVDVSDSGVWAVFGMPVPKEPGIKVVLHAPRGEQTVTREALVTRTHTYEPGRAPHGPRLRYGVALEFQDDGRGAEDRRRHSGSSATVRGAVQDERGAAGVEENAPRRSVGA